RRQMHLDGLEPGSELLDGAWADQGGGHGRMADDPGEGERTHVDAALGGARTQRVNRLERGWIHHQVPVGLRSELYARPWRRRITKAVLPGEQPTCCRTEGGDRDPFLRRQWKHVDFEGAVEQAVAILDRLIPVMAQPIAG